MRVSELKEKGKCGICGKGVMHTHLPLFWRVKIERHGIDMGAIQRHHGLEQMVGSAAIAQVLSPDENATKLIDSREFTMCETCAMEQHNFMILLGGADA